MDNFLKRIIDGKSDESVHSEFLRFGRGIFENKYLLEAKKQKDRWVIKTGPEFANVLVRSCLLEVGGNINIKGVVVSTQDLRKETSFPFGNVKQFMGVKQFAVGGEIPASSILELIDKFPRAFFALSFSTKDSEVKIKPKAPKSAKPAASGDKEPKAEFCTIKTSNKEIIEGLFGELPEFKEAKVKHILNIKEVILPVGEKDPVQVREKAKKKGTLTRIAVVDGKEIKKEYDFEA